MLSLYTKGDNYSGQDSSNLVWKWQRMKWPKTIKNSNGHLLNNNYLYCLTTFLGTSYFGRLIWLQAEDSFYCLKHPGKENRIRLTLFQYKSMCFVPTSNQWQFKFKLPAALLTVYLKFIKSFCFWQSSREWSWPFH